MCFYEETLDKLLLTAKLAKKTAYTTSNVALVLGVSNSTIINMCEEWEPPEESNRNVKGIECYRVGTHRRIPHHAIVEWLRINIYYNTLGVQQ